MNRFQKLQNKCLRNILDVDKFASSTEMLNVLNCLSVKQIIIFRTLIFIRIIIIDGDVPKYLTEKKNDLIAMVTHCRIILRNSNEPEFII